MTTGDIQELITLAGLFGLAFTIPKPRWRLVWTLNFMSINMLAGRYFILHYPKDAFAYCSLIQAVLAVALIATSETLKGVLVGLLFAVMVVGAGLTGMGYLSPLTSNGLTINYWTVMSIATYLQFVIVMFHIFQKWCANGIRNGLSHR